MHAKLWFIQLSGWPIFILIVAVVFLFMVALSILMTRLSNRSVAQNAALAAVVVAVVGFGLLGLVAILSRL
jgi:uncharacterized protein YebE (UPF0316 family)